MEWASSVGPSYTDVFSDAGLSRELTEVEEKARKKWQLIVQPSATGGPGGYPLYEDRPICSALVLDFDGMALNKSGPERVIIFDNAIHQERICNEFIRWVPGFTPKEHTEMMNEQKIREWQAERQKADKQRDEARRREDRIWNFCQAILMLLLSAIVSWAVSSFTKRTPQPVDIHISSDKTELRK